MTGQVIYHLLAAAHAARAPWPVVVLVSCIPVITLGFGAALSHLLRATDDAPAPAKDAPAKRPSRATRGAPRRRQARPAGPDIEASALAVLARRPGVSGADLGRAIGVSPRTGQRLMARLGDRDE